MDGPVIPSAIADLMPDLRSGKPALTDRAIGQASALGARAIPHLVAALKAEQNTSSRINLGKALARIGMEAWEPLLAAARETDDVDFGWSVAWAISQFKAVGAMDDFLAALHHSNVHVRWAAALALGAFADGRAVAPLIAALAEDGPITPRTTRGAVPTNYYRKVGSCAAKSLGQLGRLAVPSLFSALRSDNPLVRARAADALTGTAEPAAFDPLRVATHDPDATVRHHAFKAVAALLPALAPARQLEARDVLLSAFFEADQGTQHIGVQGLYAVGERAVTSLVGLIQESKWDAEHPFARSYAMQTLARLLAQEPPVLGLAQRLFALLAGTLREQTNPPWLRSEAALALGRTSDARAVDPLILALTDPSADIRGAVAEALLILGYRRAVPALNDALLVARAEEVYGYDVELHQWLLDELEESITALSATPGEDGA